MGLGLLLVIGEQLRIMLLHRPKTLAFKRPTMRFNRCQALRFLLFYLAARLDVGNAVVHHVSHGADGVVHLTGR